MNRLPVFVGRTNAAFLSRSFNNREFWLKYGALRPLRDARRRRASRGMQRIDPERRWIVRFTLFHPHERTILTRVRVEQP